MQQFENKKKKDNTMQRCMVLSFLNQGKFFLS